ncbi:MULTISPECIES: DUF1140 family protein [unclassified Lactococcus]|uniref:DUF1140 family protein n=1 Tax=unclassified Lactococcus TaxID=2643510 RepID=UPI0011CBD1E9|nr:MULTISPECIES: DUF1140 family protein [unclassified Lactococcus]MQW22960.1 DUF1140 family protein [Lactococcus sp. dk101]TXK44495.1 DUF1140 family protein [Lactococcus sp. dk310]TXK50348.1 DUF1140 family protein [Lactococcus sp. dk322]
MTAETIVRDYQIHLLKIIFKETESLILNKEKADNKAHELASNGHSVKTSAHWKSVGNAEFYISEMYRRLDTLAEMDRLFHWSSRLHQDGLSFVAKYPRTMKKYGLRGKVEQTNI